MITVTKKGDAYEVIVDSMTYTVTVSDEYYQELTSGKISKEDLIEKSFEFLLERESKESILSSFDLPLINKYFPEYEEEIKISS